MSEEEIESLNGYLEDLYQAMVIGDIVFEANHSLKLYNLIHKLLRENQKYKEVINKIKYICDKVPYSWSVCGIEVVHKIEKILKEVEHE